MYHLIEKKGWYNHPPEQIPFDQAVLGAALGFLKKTERLFDRLIDLQALIACAMLTLMMFLTCYEVISRYVFAKSPAWVLEVCEYMLLYVTFLGITWLLRRDGHVKVGLINTILGARAREGLGVSTCIVATLACIIIAYFGAVSTLDHFQRGIKVFQTLNTPKWVLIIIIPLGSIMLSIELLRQLVHRLKKDPEE